MNKININHLFVLLFICLFGYSCKTTQKLTSYQPLESALLWQIEGNGLKEHSYLFGTIHMIEAESFYWPKGTLAAIEDADQLTFEIDMDEMTDMGAQMSLFSKAMMNDGTTLPDLLSEEDYKAVSDHFSGMGLPMFLLDKIKPMFLTVFAGDIDINSMQDGSTKSYEMELFDIANDSDKEVHGLESIEYQISVFDSIPYQDQAQMLVDALGNSDTDGDQFQQMMDLYKSQNIENMIKFMSEEESGIGDFEDVLLNDRNKNWIPIMTQQMNEKQTFFAVGAGHLAGDEGVIHLLRKEGFKLKPLSL